VVIRINQAPKFRPSLLVENIVTSAGTGPVVQEYGGKTLLSFPIPEPWTSGPRVADNMPDGMVGAGAVKPRPLKPTSLLSNGKFAPANRKAIQNALNSAALQKKVLVFPAGIYPVDNTLVIPVGSRIAGALWSQIMAVGPAFGDASKPKVLAK
jgi:hypothetical protein